MNSKDVPEYLYKVINPNQWKESEGKENVKLSPEDKKFIHLATSDQVTDIVMKYFGKNTCVWILKLDVKKLPGKLVLEVNPGGTNAYYHLYNGAIPRSAVVERKAIGCAF